MHRFGIGTEEIRTIYWVVFVLGLGTTQENGTTRTVSKSRLGVTWSTTLMCGKNSKSNCAPNWNQGIRKSEFLESWYRLLKESDDSRNDGSKSMWTFSELEMPPHIKIIQNSSEDIFNYKKRMFSGWRTDVKQSNTDWEIVILVTLDEFNHHKKLFSGEIFYRKG